MAVYSRIVGTGSYLPERVIDNHELESMTSDFDRARSGCTLDEWVTDHIGVSSRHRAAPGEGSGSMAAAAGRRFSWARTPGSPATCWGRR